MILSIFKSEFKSVAYLLNDLYNKMLRDTRLIVWNCYFYASMIRTPSHKETTYDFNTEKNN